MAYNFGEKQEIIRAFLQSAILKAVQQYRPSQNLEAGGFVFAGAMASERPTMVPLPFSMLNEKGITVIAEQVPSCSDNRDVVVARLIQ